MSYGSSIRPRTSGRLAVVERIDKTIRNLLDTITAGVLFQKRAYLQVTCLHVIESLVDRRWSSGLSGSGTVEC